MQADNVTRGLLAAILLLLVLSWLDGRRAGGEAAPTEPRAAAVGANARFEIRPVALRRGPPLLVRLDSATGQAWRMGLMDPPAWEPLAEGANGVPAPDADRPGRFAVYAYKQTRGAPTLVRIDSQTGEIWRKGSQDKRPWVPVPNPAAAAPAGGGAEEASVPATDLDSDDIAVRVDA